MNQKEEEKESLQFDANNYNENVWIGLVTIDQMPVSVDWYLYISFTTAYYGILCTPTASQGWSDELPNISTTTGLGGNRTRSPVMPKLPGKYPGQICLNKIKTIWMKFELKCIEYPIRERK